LSFSLSDLVGFLTGLTLITQISGLFFKLTGIAVSGNKRNQILKIKMQNCGAASRAVLISEFRARELPLKWNSCLTKAIVSPIINKSGVMKP